jgi:hypothetical protein
LSRRPPEYAERLLNEEILPAIRTLKTDAEEGLKRALRKYLIVSLASTLEYFFKSQAKQYADKYDIDLTTIFKGELRLPVSQLGQMVKEEHIITSGNIIVSSINFLDLEQVDWLFSKMLRINFLDYILKLNNANKYRYVFRGHPIPIEYEKIKQAFELRHKIVHDLYDADLSDWKIICLWDNAMNIMDVGTSLFIPELQQQLKIDYMAQAKREGRIKAKKKSRT